jgi:cytochrome c oxidase accessory protein FixG
MSWLKNFEKRARTYPQDVKGKFRNIKNISGIIFLIIFFFSPYLRFDRGLDLASQAILIDIVNSRGYFFFIKIWPEEAYYLAGLLIFGATALFFITSLFGRVWCGYSCPQTVWTDLFIKVERLFQGDRNERIILDRKQSLNKFLRKSATHIVWILISLITGFGFVLYFNDAIITTKNLLDLNLSWSIIGWISGVAGMTYIMAGFAREQVCNYMCPYARFQSAMFDDDTLIISYDKERGEPRQKYKQGSSFDGRGHCIDCKQCVVVCPANIDIRDGLQMECIACGLCVDACNDVMKKVGLPQDLIKYDTGHHMNDQKNDKVKFRILKPRTFYYSAILALIGGIIIFNLSVKSTIDLKIIPTRNPLFVTLSNGNIRNGYEVKIYNKSNFKQSYRLEIDGIDDVVIKVQNPPNLDLEDINIKSDSISEIKLYISSKKEDLNLVSGKNKIRFSVIENETDETISSDSVFISSK